MPGIVALLILSSITLYAPSAHAEQQHEKEQNVSTNQLTTDSSNQENLSLIRSYVKKNINGTLYIDSSYTSNPLIPKESIENLQTYYAWLNSKIVSGEVSVTKNLDIIQPKTNSASPFLAQAQAKSAGKNGYQLY
uniref:hypothetical protein n=1 Tax=Sporolactobacillus terrae TaxID=269673 RepID=UPI00111AC185